MDDDPQRERQLLRVDGSQAHHLIVIVRRPRQSVELSDDGVDPEQPAIAAEDDVPGIAPGQEYLRVGEKLGDGRQGDDVHGHLVDEDLAFDWRAEKVLDSLPIDLPGFVRLVRRQAGQAVQGRLVGQPCGAGTGQGVALFKGDDPRMAGQCVLEQGGARPRKPNDEAVFGDARRPHAILAGPCFPSHRIGGLEVVFHHLRVVRGALGARRQGRGSLGHDCVASREGGERARRLAGGVPRFAQKAEGFGAVVVREVRPSQ